MRMRNRLSIMIIVVMAFGLIIPMETYAKSSTMDEVKAEKNKVNEKVRKKESEIDAVLQEMETLYDELAEVEAEVTKKEEKIKEQEEKIDSYTDEFKAHSEEIGVINETMEQRNEILKARLASYQEQGGEMSFLDVIFTSSSFNDFISRVSSVSAITNADRELLDQQEQDKQAIVTLQNEIVEKIAEQEKMMEEVEASYEKVNEQKKTIEDKESSLASKQETLDEEKASLESESVALSKKEEEIVAKAEEAARKKEEKAANKAKETTEKKTTSTNNKQSSKPKNNNTNNDKPKNTNGKLQAGDKLKVEATAYGPDCVGCSGFTATGMDVRPKNGKVPKVIAVDPTVIPLGSVVKVPGYGTAIAADTGGAIKGNIIDVLMKSEKVTGSWGRQHITIEIISTP